MRITPPMICLLAIVIFSFFLASPSQSKEDATDLAKFLKEQITLNQSQKEKFKKNPGLANRIQAEIDCYKNYIDLIEKAESDPAVSIKPLMKVFVEAIEKEKIPADPITTRMFAFFMERDDAFKAFVEKSPFSLAVIWVGSEDQSLQTKFEDTFQITAAQNGIAIPKPGAPLQVEQEIKLMPQGSIMGTRMQSVRAGGSLRLLAADGTLKYSWHNTAVGAHINTDEATAQAILALAKKAVQHLMFRFIKEAAAGG